MYVDIFDKYWKCFDILFDTLCHPLKVSSSVKREKPDGHDIADFKRYNLRTKKKTKNPYTN